MGWNAIQATTLHNLLLHLDNAKQETRACGGVEAFSSLLDGGNVKLLALVCDALYLLLLDHPHSKLVFLTQGGPGNLVQILRTTSYSKLVYTALRCIRTISVCPQNKAALIT